MTIPQTILIIVMVWYHQNIKGVKEPMIAIDPDSAYLLGRNFNDRKYILNNNDANNSHHLKAKANSKGTIKKARF